MTRHGIPPAQARVETVGFWDRMMPLDDDAPGPNPQWIEMRNPEVT